jgi:hypothetical protein
MPQDDRDKIEMALDMQERSNNDGRNFAEANLVLIDYVI